MSQPRSLDTQTLTALVELVKDRLPAGSPITLDRAEAAVVQLLRDVGPQLLGATLTGDTTSPAVPRRGKKGHRRAAPAVE